jgi:wyosine [tRNA(Phe)-imidazoG37] synthetase (radical SAM superfamily)
VGTVAEFDRIARLSLDELSSVYGPVPSWRVGASLGVDLLCVNSICSFNCSYCQLGNIQVHTGLRRLFVPTQKVVEDFRRSAWRRADVITFSGSGEPTLAVNLGETILWTRDFSGKPTLVLTNGTLLDDVEVRSELGLADRVFVKLDAATDATFRRVNRPVPGVTLGKIVEGAAAFRREYGGFLGVQMMFLPSTHDRAEDFAPLLIQIEPDEVQLNTPTRPYPGDWYLQSRGSHEEVDYPAKPLKPLSSWRLGQIAAELSRLAPGLKFRVHP